MAGRFAKLGDLIRLGTSKLKTSQGTTLLALTTAATATSISYASTSQPQPTLRPPTDLPPTPTDQQSNQSTAQWRVFTDVARDLAAKRNYKEAEVFLLKALAAAEAGWGKQDPHFASACNNLAELYRITRQFDKAAPLYEQAVSILVESYGSKDVRE